MIKMLKGGLDDANPDRYSFITGRVSDTRLMGVVAMHLAYYDLAKEETFHQCYYFDYEELGLEHINILRGGTQEDLNRFIREGFAGLGANLVKITEKEGRYLLQWMIEDTIKKHQMLPPELDQLKFLYRVYSEDRRLQGAAARTGMDQDELAVLNSKMCTPIKSDYGILNYYLMRIFGKDPEGAALLAETDISENISPKIHCTFLKNKISLLETNGQHKLYRCESIVEVEKESRHHLVVSEIELYRRKVSSARKISDTKVSLLEAGLALSKEEYITVYNPVKGFDPEQFVKGFNEFALGMTRTEHDSGMMFIDFKTDNKHAENKVFLLSDDVRALFYITGSGQIVSAAYELYAIIEAEERLYKSSFGKDIQAVGRYNFAASIIYDFAESGGTDFLAYIEELDLL